MFSQNVVGKEPKQLMRDLTEGEGGDLRRRRAVVLTSMAGIASMAAVTLLQMGVVRHLPDPPVRGFDSDKVNLSPNAYAMGLPDGALAIAMLGGNLPLAAFGGTDRARRLPWIPLLAAGKAVIEAAAAARFFYLMPAKERAWCGYCIAGAIANLVIAGLTLPEAKRAWRAMRREHPPSAQAA